MLRTSAVAYDASDVTNRFAHLTNHCIATEHGDYGTYNPNPNPDPDPDPDPDPNV